MGWWKRWQQRQRELAQGVDADLIHDNNGKFGRAFCFIGLGVLLWLLDDKVDLPHPLPSIVEVAGSISFIGGGLVAGWAWRERVFLERPDAEKPPSILN